MKKANFFLNNPKRTFMLKCMRVIQVKDGVVLMFGKLEKMRNRADCILSYAHKVFTCSVIQENPDGSDSYGIHVCFSDKYDKCWVEKTN